MSLPAMPPSSRLVLVGIGSPTGFPEVEVVQPCQPFLVVAGQQTKGTSLQPFSQGRRHIAALLSVHPLNLHVANLATGFLGLVEIHFTGIPQLGKPGAGVFEDGIVGV